MRELGRTAAGAALLAWSLSLALPVDAAPETTPPTASPAAQPLSLQAAIDGALATNPQAQLARVNQDDATGQRIQARAAFLPHLSGQVSEARRQTNLAAQGFNFGSDVATPPAGSAGQAGGFGFSFPTTVTYNNFDARATLRQTLFNDSDWQKYKGAKIGERAARARLSVAKQQVATQAELDYVAYASAEAAVQAAQADIQQATALLKLARDQQHVGVATGLDVTRAHARLARDQATLAQRRAHAVQARIELARTVGLGLGTPIALTDPLVFRPMPVGSVQHDIAEALANRPAIAMASLQVAQQQTALSAARGERLPTLSLEADYGESGNTPGENSRPTYAVGATVSIPIFDGGMISGRIDSATAELNEQQIRLRNTQLQVEQDVRTSRAMLIQLAAQVRAARSNLTFAKQQLQLSKDRFAHGVGDNVDVVDAQSALSDARLSRINALAEYTRARINLAAALGRAGQFSLTHPIAP